MSILVKDLSGIPRKVWVKIYAADRTFRLAWPEDDGMGYDEWRDNQEVDYEPMD